MPIDDFFYPYYSFERIVARLIDVLHVTQLREITTNSSADW